VVSFKRGGLQVKSHAWDRNFGGRDLDEAMFDHFCEGEGGHGLVQPHLLFLLCP
jgi:hypothetical protein